MILIVLKCEVRVVFRRLGRDVATKLTHYLTTFSLRLAGYSSRSSNKLKSSIPISCHVLILKCPGQSAKSTFRMTIIFDECTELSKLASETILERSFHLISNTKNCTQNRHYFQHLSSLRVSLQWSPMASLGLVRDIRAVIIDCNALSIPNEMK